MTHANVKFRRDAYHFVNPDSTSTVHPFSDALQVLKSSGLITEAQGEGLMQFSAPLVRVVLERKLFLSYIHHRSLLIIFTSQP